MLYLEDYLELIDNLPSSIRDILTEVRELDLTIHNAMDTLDEEVKTFFLNAKRMKQDVRDTEYRKIRDEYDKTLEDADEKVNLANQIYELVDRYLRRLDQELQKFKIELEADNSGITEILERRSLELDSSPPVATSNHVREKRRAYPTHGGQYAQSTDPSAGQSTTPSAARTLLHYVNGAQSNPLTNPLAAAATLAIHTTTQQMQQGRRTASLKASIEAITMLADDRTSSDNQSVEPFDQWRSGNYTPGDSSQWDSAFSLGNQTETGLGEERYCICQQFSYGDMIACDNSDCPYEWFHYACVDLTAAPSGKWYCSTKCASAGKSTAKSTDKSAARSSNKKMKL